MKKLITAVLLLSAVFFSCNQAVKGDYATVVVDLGGSSSGARAIGQNGLPFLKDTRIRIEANGRVGGTVVKEFAPGEVGNIALRLIIGDTVSLRVKAFNASGIWSGSTTFTVEEGVSAVSVKLNRTISGAQALTFSMTKTGTHGNNPLYTVNLYVGNKKIDSKDNVLSSPSFCRDGKGRIFVAYHYESSQEKVDLVRYDSEGNNATRLIPGEQSGSVWSLTSDMTTGKVYVLDDNKKLYEVGEDPLSPTTPTNWRRAVINGFTEVHSIAAHGGQLFVLGKTGSGEELYVYDNIDNQLSTATPIPQIQLPATPNTVVDPSPPDSRTYTDMFVTDDAVYLLRKEYVMPPVSSGNVYSKGALIKYEYDRNDKEIDDEEEFGESNEDAKNGIVPTGDNCFYGPLKFVGFDDDVLYIADDGVALTYFNEAPRISANKNRIASFNTASNSLSFADTSATWAKEEKTLPQKTLLWKVRTKGYTSIFDYYAVDGADSPLGARPDIESESKPDEYYTDVFCFDQAGALYVLKKGSSGHTVVHTVVRYETTAEGGYDFLHSNEVQLSGSIDDCTSIAVDVSGTITDSNGKCNALYYYYVDSLDNNKRKIGRISWQTTDNFSIASTNGYNGIDVDSLISVTALAANRDGLFVATESGTPGFTIQKFDHDGNFDNDIQIHDDVGTINALQIADGILYGISTKTEVRDGFSMWGKLLKIGGTENFDEEEAFYYDMNNASNGDFAPYRFIAVKPKKLVIASDGAYGLEDKTSYNKNRVLIFTLDGSGDIRRPSSFDPDPAVTFSKELYYHPSGWFDW